MDIFFWLGTATLAGLFAFGIEGAYGAMRIKRLDDIAPLNVEAPPRVSVIIPALNEQGSIRAALQSVLSLDYDQLEIIVLNDRSTDGTPEILSEIAALHEKLKIIHIHALPDGWLGKNHALYQGALQATGEYFLFSDADVIMEKSTLRRAMAYLLDKKLDHLTLFFKAVLPSSLLHMVVMDLGIGLVAFLKPWKASDRASKKFIGVGAFNLVKAASYWQAGGHEAIRLCPLDDLKLGLLMKMHDFRQDCLYGHNFLSVKWYSSLGEMARGLLKNTFAALDYRFSKLCILTLLQFLLGIWPFWALLLLEGPAWVVNLAIVLFTGVLFLSAALKSGISPRHVAWFPVTPYVRIYMTWQAVLLTLRRGGIVWRGTFYPLSDLKKSDLKRDFSKP